MIDNANIDWVSVDVTMKMENYMAAMLALI